MSPSTEQLLNSAQTLSAAEQIELVDAIIAGLDEIETPPLGDAWMAEIQRRSAELDAGLVKPIPWSDLRTLARGQGSESA